MATVLLGELLGLDWQLVTEERSDYQIELPNGRSIRMADVFFGRHEQWLDVRNIPAAVSQMAHPFSAQKDVIGLYGEPVFKENSDGLECGLDLWASTFFMLTRWEEFIHPDRDEHGRFPAKTAVSVRANFLHRPVVNEWADLLWDMLKQCGLQAERLTRNYQLHLSCDVDHPLLWWRPMDRWRTVLGSLLRRGNPAEAFYWIKKIIKGGNDPYDVYNEWMDMAERHGLQWHYNFLGERPKSSDAWYPLNHPFVLNLMEKITDRGHVVGFHPGYEAFENAAQFNAELASLRRACPAPIESGRQHYLRFASPSTWRQWAADEGLKWDSSLGYSEAEGFRCGICCEFPVFDFLERKMLPLREKPLIVMDVTLALARGYSPEEALEKMSRLRATVRQHQGEYVLLWHNSSWNTYFWADWQHVLSAFIATN